MRCSQCEDWKSNFCKRYKVKALGRRIACTEIIQNHTSKIEE